MRPLFAAEMLSDIIGLIYDCAIDPGCWPVAMEAIRIELGCAVGVLALHALPEAKLIVHHTVNVPAAYRAPEAGEDDDAADVWGGIARLMSLPLDQPLVLSSLNPAAMPFGTETRNRASILWAKPQGLQDVIGVFLARDQGAFGILGFPRHLSAGLISAREVELMRLLIPHLQRAATINRLIEAARTQHDALQATIDMLGVAIILIDGDLRIVHANMMAHRLLARGDLIQDQAGILATASPAGTRALKTAIERPGSHDRASARSGSGIPISGHEMSHGVLHVMPIGEMPYASDPARPVAAVFVAHVDAAQLAPTEIVASLYGLTPSEARVFQLVADGDTMADVARTLGVELSTVKTHVVRLYAKTGVRRRSELQRLASALTLPLAS